MSNLLEKKIGNIELELQNLKSIIIQLIQKPEPKKLVKLKGLLQGIRVDDKDIKEAKSALFRAS